MSTSGTPGRADVAVVCGTRPEVIKLAGIIRRLGTTARVIHTGQHYTETMARDFLEELGIGEPAVQFEIGGSSRGSQIGETTRLIDEHFGEEPPIAAIVQGDTNTALGAALAANATGVPLAHVEAGLRSYDRAMPEEHNRVLIDHLADLCCAPTEVSRANLAREAITGERVVVTGNTVVEAVTQLLPPASRRRALLRERDVQPAGFVLSTFHRPENVDDRDSLAVILEALASLPVPVVLPLHPRTTARAAAFGLEALLEDLIVTPPAGYREFLGLAAESALLVSDSGGVQEEASVLKRPVIVVRNSTERPEVQGTFATLVRPGPAIRETATEWLRDVSGLHDRLRAIPCPYGDERAASHCIAALERTLGRRLRVVEGRSG